MRSLLVLGVVALSMVFLFAVVYATQQKAPEAPDNITMESKVFKKHKKALVNLSHKKHNVDYKIPCNDCHHIYDEHGKNTWTQGAEVKKCDACHTEAKAPKVKKGEPKIPKKEMIKKYYYSAIHENCVGCHKALKKADKEKPVPTKCTECHPKKTK